MQDVNYFERQANGTGRVFHYCSALLIHSPVIHCEQDDADDTPVDYAVGNIVQPRTGGTGIVPPSSDTAPASADEVLWTSISIRNT
jgi:hypothetical protein